MIRGRPLRSFDLKICVKALPIAADYSTGGGDCGPVLFNKRGHTDGQGLEGARCAAAMGDFESSVIAVVVGADRSPKYRAAPKQAPRGLLAPFRPARSIGRPLVGLYRNRRPRTHPSAGRRCRMTQPKWPKSAPSVHGPSLLPRAHSSLNSPNSPSTTRTRMESGSRSTTSCPQGPVVKGGGMVQDRFG